MGGGGGEPSAYTTCPSTPPLHNRGARRGNSAARPAMLPTIAAAAVALALARRWLTRLSNAQPSPSPASPVPPTTDIPPTTEADAVSQQMPPTTSPHPTIAPPPRSTTLVRAAVNASAIAWPPVQASTPSMPRTGEEPPPLSDESQVRVTEPAPTEHQTLTSTREDW
jgi:hypothetical protein